MIYCFNLSIILIYLLICQLDEIFTTMGNVIRKNKFLSFFIWYTFVSLLISTFDNELLIIIKFYLII